MASSGLEDIAGPFKFLARSGDYSRVSLEVHSSLTIRPEPQLYFRAAMMQLIESCLEIVQATTSRDFDHWLADPVLFRVFQDVFQQIMSVLGVPPGRCMVWRICVCCRTASCMPLWLSLIGAFTSLELSGRPGSGPFCTWRLFGRKRNGGSNAASSRSDAAPSSNASSAGSSSAASPKPAVRPSAADPAPEGDDQGPEAFDAVRPEAEEEPETLKPLFDFKKVYKRLKSDIIQRDPMKAKRLLRAARESPTSRTC